jgi:hypothetical protein
VKTSFTPPHQQKQEKIEQLMKVQLQIEEETVSDALLNQEKEAQ